MTTRLFGRVKRYHWLIAAAAAFVLCVADCLYRNRDGDAFGDPLFLQFALVCAVSFASFACTFLFSRFWIAAPLIAAGGACVFLFAPDLREPYPFVSLPAILTVSLLRYCPPAEKRSPAAAAAWGVTSALELAGSVYLICTLIAANETFLQHLLPFLRWRGRLSNNDYGFMLLLILFVIYAVSAIRRMRASAAQPEKERKKKPGGAAPASAGPGAWLRFAAVCLFFVSAALWCLRNCNELFFPVPTFVNLAAGFVLVSRLSCPDAGPDDLSVPA